jgi:phosphopantetheinyl transferase
VKIIELPQSWRSRAIVITGITPALDWFSEEELREAEQLRREKRRDEWMAARVAAKQLALNRGMCENAYNCWIARPYLIVRGLKSHYVSISHSERFAAAAIDEHPVGVDVQAIRDIDERTTKFFLTHEETKAMRSCAIADRLLHFWCAKEAEWKRRGGDPLTLKKVPLAFEAEQQHGLRFDSVETIALPGAIAALTRPTS